MVNNIVLLLILFSAGCAIVRSGCIVNDISNIAICKSVGDLHKENKYTELSNVEINSKVLTKFKYDEQGDGEKWPIITNDAFRGMKNLETVIIRNNVSHIEPHAFRGIDQPFKLILMNNTLEELPEELLAGVPVHIFVMNGTNLKELNRNIFKNSLQLTETLLQANKLTTIRSDVFQDTNIASVDLQHNQIATIADGAFDCMKKLFVLDLGNNKLTTFNADRVLGSSSPIEVIYLDSNQLTTVVKYPALPKLRVLSLEKNSIVTIEDNAFAELNKLVVLYLSHNELKTISANILPRGDDTIMTVFYIDGNRLRYLDKAVTTRLTQVRMLGADKNPWKCSYLLDLMQWAKKRNVELACGDPKIVCNISCTK